MDQQNSTIIRVEHVSKLYGLNKSEATKMMASGSNKDEVYKKTGCTVALWDVNLEIPRGKIFVIIGLSGSGKSTLVRCFNRLNRPTMGKVFFDGRDLSELDKKELLEFRRSKISMVFQSFGLMSHRDVLGNVAYGLEVRGMARAEREQKAMEVISMVGLEGWEHQSCAQLSGGMRQRVGIARALANDPEVLLMDEPFSALDPLVRRDMQFELLQIQRKLQKTVVFITHDMDEAFKLGDTVAIMRDGKVVKDTPASETSVDEITKCMVGRSVDLSAVREIRDCSDARTIMSIRKLWVDMPGEIVRNVNLDVKEGEILGIGGLAGQGKLGIPNGVMGLYEAGGTVEFDGKPIPLNNPRKCLDAQLAFVSEDRRGVGLLLDETLEWNVAFPAMQIQNKFLKKYGPITWRDTKAIHDVTQKYIDELKIKCTSSKQKARELSGGNQQKVCLAKAFALQPRFLFVSEPTRGIDVGAKALVLDALKKFNRENGVTVVMISSELEELRTTCDRIAIVSGGRIVGILPATESSETFGALMVSQVK